MDLHAATVSPSMLPDLREQVKQIITETRRQGASACEVAVSLEQGLSTSMRRGEVETAEFNHGQGFGIILCAGQRRGLASTSAIDEATIRETVATALAIARHTSEDECAGLVNTALIAHELPELDLYHPWSLSPKQVVERTLVCETTVLAANKRVTEADDTALNTHQGCRVYGNGHGFIGGYASTRHSLSCVMIAEDEGQMQRDYWYDVNRRGEVLVSVESIGRYAAERVISRPSAWPVQTVEVPALFAPEIAVGLFGHFLEAISGGSLHHKPPFLEGALGRRLLPEWLNIDERPHLVDALGNASFDSDGLATYVKPFIENGELVSYVLGIYSGRKLGLPNTVNASGVHNLLVSHGDENQAAPVHQMGCGLLVTELMGQDANLVTGNYSRSVAGYQVENDEIQFPVQEATIVANLRGPFRCVVTVGKDIERRDNLHTGSVLVESMIVARC